MSKELPYFKFYTSAWSNGDITLESYELQGLFINICAYYWSKDCQLSLVNLVKKFRFSEDKIDELISAKILKVDRGNIVIHFLIEQMSSKEIQKITNQINGKKGGRPPKKETEKKPNGFINETEIEANVNPKQTNIKERKGDNIDDVLGSSSPQSSLFSIHQFEEVVEIGENEFTLLATRKTKRSVEQLQHFLKAFLIEQKAMTKIVWQNSTDAKSHFINWVNKQPLQTITGYTPQLTN